MSRVEINEAFSSVAKNSTRMLGVDEEIVNVNGGAVALGHPIGASGGRIVATMVHELRRAGGGLGLAAICSGGGQGDALLDRGLKPLFVIALVALAFAGQARAASCPNEPLRTLLDDSDAAVVGRVVSVSESELRGQPERVLTVQVDQWVKGDVGRTVVVRTPSGTDLDVDLPQDKAVRLPPHARAGRVVVRERVRRGRPGKARRRGRRAAWRRHQGRPRHGPPRARPAVGRVASPQGHAPESPGRTRALVGILPRVRFEHVVVVGAGQMGGGIAQVVAASGRRVSLHDEAPGAVERALATMERSLGKLADKGGAAPTRCSPA